MSSSIGLLSLPAEILQYIACILVAQTPLSPPSQLIPLFLICKHVYARLLSSSGNALFARIFRLQFDAGAVTRRLSMPLAQCLRDQLISWSLTVRTVRRYAEGTGEEEEGDVETMLYNVFLMMLDNDGKNYAQLANAGIHHVIDHYVRHCIWDPDSSDDWPIDSPAASAALWIMWLTLEKYHIANMSQENKEALIKVLLPYVLLTHRYPASEAPPNHFELPLTRQQQRQNPPRQQEPLVFRLPSAYPHYIPPSSRTLHIPYFLTYPAFSVPPASIPAKLLFVAVRESRTIVLPPVLPPTLTAADYHTLNEAKAAVLRRGATWDWDEGIARSVNPVPGISASEGEPIMDGDEESQRWDTVFWRANLCGDFTAPRPKFLPGEVYEKGAMCAAWQGKIYMPQVVAFSRLLQTTKYPGPELLPSTGTSADPTTRVPPSSLHTNGLAYFSEQALGLVMQPVFLDMREHHRVCMCTGENGETSCGVVPVPELVRRWGEEVEGEDAAGAGEERRPEEEQQQAATASTRRRAPVVTPAHGQTHEAEQQQAVVAAPTRRRATVVTPAHGETHESATYLPPTEDTPAVGIEQAEIEELDREMESMYRDGVRAEEDTEEDEDHDEEEEEEEYTSDDDEEDEEDRLTRPTYVDVSMCNAWFPGRIGGVGWLAREALPLDVGHDKWASSGMNSHSPNGQQRRAEVVFAANFDTVELMKDTYDVCPRVQQSAVPHLAPRTSEKRKRWVYEMYDERRVGLHDMHIYGGERNPYCASCVALEEVRLREKATREEEARSVLERVMRGFNGEEDEREGEYEEMDMDDVQSLVGGFEQILGTKPISPVQSSPSSHSKTTHIHTSPSSYLSSSSSSSASPSLSSSASCPSSTSDTLLTGSTSSSPWQVPATLYGRIRKWDGLVGLLRCSVTPPINYIFIFGYIVGGGPNANFVAEWRLAGADPLKPVWSGALVMSRKGVAEGMESG